MYTNLDDHGGDFRAALNSEFVLAENVTIASGYASSDIVKAYYNDLIRIANRGGNSKLLLGMAFYEGLNQKKLDLLSELNDELQIINPDSGVYVTNGRRYHGKVYLFESMDKSNSNIYLGSSNFSSSGTKSNIECTIPITLDAQKNQIKSFMTDLFSDDYSINLAKAAIRVPGKKKLIARTIDSSWNALKKYDPKSIDISKLPSIDIPLDRIVEQEKSNLNTYFGKGRLNSSTGIITPRPWYEIEIISSNDLNPHTQVVDNVDLIH